MRHLPALVLAAALLTACGSSDDSTADPAPASDTPSQSPTPTPTPSEDPSEEPTEEPTEEPAGQVLEIRVAGDDITPNAAAIDLAVGEPLTLSFDADRAGELHVHAKPEQYVEFAEGTSTTELVIDTPGSVEVEEHESGAVVAQIRVQ